MLRTTLKIVGALLATMIVVAVLVFTLAWRKTEASRETTYTVNDPPLVMNSDADTLANGEHFFKTRGCADCHGENGAGQLVIDAGPVMQVIAPNITPNGKVKGWSVDQIAAAIRHGVKADGHSVLFMPSSDFNNFSDDDTMALVAYVQALPPSENDPGAFNIGPLGRVLYWAGKLPLFPAENIDHSPKSRAAPTLAATAEYGKYIAQGCTGCHGQNYAGQHVPGTPPEFPDAANITPGGALKTWSEKEFVAAIRTGKRPDGSAINEFMPWRAFSHMSDTELSAIWLYLQTLPAVATTKK